MLSIGKLSQLAHMQNHDVPMETPTLDGKIFPSSLQADNFNERCSL